MNNREVRTFQTEIRAIEAEDAGALRLGGYVARFSEGSEDLGGFRERVANGAFTQTLLTDDIRGLFNHGRLT